MGPKMQFTYASIQFEEFTHVKKESNNWNLNK